MMYSVVIPIYNEEEVLPELYKRLTAVMETLGAPYEVIFVDDGSIDRSFHILENLHRMNKSVKVIKFSRNFGHHIAAVFVKAKRVIKGRAEVAVR